MISIETIVQDLRNMGVNEGDTLLVRANLANIGQISSKDKMDYLEAFIKAVGEAGTIVGLSFTRSFMFKVDKDFIYDGTNSSYTGAFSNIMLKHKNALRSMHPTNSFVAIGKNAKHIVEDHNENSGSYEPVRKIMELNGKMILVGCVKDSPGFTTTHLAECDLKYYKKIIFPGLDRVFYRKKGNDKVHLFKRKDKGSCSSTFGKFYNYYIKQEKLVKGYVGQAYSIMINAKEAYEIDHSVLKANPKITICNDPDCFLCRARRWDNLLDLPGFVFRTVWHKYITKKV